MDQLGLAPAILLEQVQVEPSQLLGLIIGQGDKCPFTPWKLPKSQNSSARYSIALGDVAALSCMTMNEFSSEQQSINWAINPNLCWNKQVRLACKSGRKYNTTGKGKHFPFLQIGLQKIQWVYSDLCHLWRHYSWVQALPSVTHPPIIPSPVP